MKKIQWVDVIGIICISIIIFITGAAGIISYNQKPAKSYKLYSIEVHDGDSIVIYKNHYQHGK